MSGSPDETQSASEALPRYLSMLTTRSSESSDMVFDSHTGSGTQESREKEKRGSQPPRQYAPTPHSPYSVIVMMRQRWWECNTPCGTRARLTRTAGGVFGAEVVRTARLGEDGGGAEEGSPYGED